MLFALSITLFCKVWFPVNVATVLSIAIVNCLVKLSTVVSIPVLPVTCNDSLSKSIEAEPVSAVKSKSCAVTLSSTYVLIAFAEARVLSSEVIDTDKSVSTTLEAKSATSILDIEFPVPFASNVLFVKVCVDEAVSTSACVLIVIVSPETEVSIFVPPVNVNVSEPNATPSSVPLSAAISNVVDIVAVPAAVKRPCWSTVNVGIAVEEP